LSDGSIPWWAWENYWSMNFGFGTNNFVMFVLDLAIVAWFSNVQKNHVFGMCKYFFLNCEQILNCLLNFLSPFLFFWFFGDFFLYFWSFPWANFPSAPKGRQWHLSPPWKKYRKTWYWSQVERERSWRLGVGKREILIDFFIHH
jgi:hypothetical protein